MKKKIFASSMKNPPKIFEIVILLLVGITAVLWFRERNEIGKTCFLFLLIYMFMRFYKRDNATNGGNRMTKFPEMVYKRPDLDEVKGKLTALTERLKNAKSYDEAKAV